MTPLSYTDELVHLEHDRVLLQEVVESSFLKQYEIENHQCAFSKESWQHNAMICNQRFAENVTDVHKITNL